MVFSLLAGKGSFGVFLFSFCWGGCFRLGSCCGGIIMIFPDCRAFL